MNEKIILPETQTIPGENTRQTKAVSMIIFSGDLDRLLAAFIIANGSAAMEVPVTMFFTFWGLNVLRREGVIQTSQKKTWTESMFGCMMPRGPEKIRLSKMNMGGIGTILFKKEMTRKKIYTLPELIKQAQEQGVKFIACSMSMDLMGIKKEELIPGIEFAGVATFVDVAEAGHITLFI
jgi:peroxiredoxin family protein